MNKTKKYEKITFSYEIELLFIYETFIQILIALLHAVISFESRSITCFVNITVVFRI